MRRAVGYALVFIVLAGCGTTVQPPEMASPANWGKETFPLPPSFARFFPFHGKEIIRFAPGWGNKGQPDYWSYAYLWMLQDSPDLSTTNLEKAMYSYYTGLVGSNIMKRQIPTEKQIPVIVKLIPGSDSASWTGTVNMLDYMAGDPVTLNVRIRPVPVNDAKTRCLYLEMSPVTPGQGIWKEMDTLVRAR